MPDINLSPEQATAVITEAIQDKFDEGPVYAGNMPDSPDKRVEIATELVGFAIEAWVQDNMRGQEVADILNAASVTIDDDGKATQNGNGAAPKAAEPKPPTSLVILELDGNKVEVPEAAAPALEAVGWERYVEPTPEPESEPELPTELTVLVAGSELTLGYDQAMALVNSGAAELLVEKEETPLESEDESDIDEAFATGELSESSSPSEDPYADQELEEPWDGYDAAKDTEIRTAMADFSEEEIAYVKAYEAAHKDRKRISNFSKEKVKSKPRDEEPQGDPEELEAAQEAEEAAERDTEGETEYQVEADTDLEPEEKMPQAEFEPAVVEEEEFHHGMPILSAHDERELALAEVKKSRLPIPSGIENPPEFPEDIASISDGELATLHSKFNACLASANWQLGLVTVDERAFRHIADATVREVRRDLDPTNPTTGKPKGRELLDKEAEDDARVQAWRERQFNAELRAIPLRRLVEIYSSYVDVLSRQWTFRSKEQESSGLLSNRSQ